MIRFSAFLVVVAVGLLVAGVVTSKLLLVYIAIGVSGVALLALGIGAAVNWRELTGKPETAELTMAETSAQGPAPAEPGPGGAGPGRCGSSIGRGPGSAGPARASGPSRSAPVPGGRRSRLRRVRRPVTAASIPSGPSRAGYLPAAEPPPRAKPAAAPGVVGRVHHAPRDPGARCMGVARRLDPSPVAGRPGLCRSGGPRRTAPACAAARPTPRRPATSPRLGSSRRLAPGQGKARRRREPQPEPEPESGTDPEPDSGAGTAGRARADSRSRHRSGRERLAAPAASVPAAAQSKQDGQAEPDEQDKQAGEAEPAGPDPSMEVTVVPGVPRYHNARCILIRFMGDSDLDKMTLAAARDVGCTPCRACLPDEPDKSPE